MAMLQMKFSFKRNDRSDCDSRVTKSVSPSCRRREKGDARMLICAPPKKKQCCCHIKIGSDLMVNSALDADLTCGVKAIGGKIRATSDPNLGNIHEIGDGVVRCGVLVFSYGSPSDRRKVTTY
jgi:hypothetical protein